MAVHGRQGHARRVRLDDAEEQTRQRRTGRPPGANPIPYVRTTYELDSVT